MPNIERRGERYVGLRLRFGPAAVMVVVVVGI